MALSISDAAPSAPPAPAVEDRPFLSAWAACSYVDHFPQDRKAREGVAVLERALRQFPGDAEVSVRLAEFDLAAGRKDAARARLAPFLKSGARLSGRMHVLAARLAQAEGDRALAARCLRTGLEQQPNHADLHLMAGSDRLERGDHRGALPHLEAAVNLQPFNGPALVALARCLENGKDHARTERVAALALAVLPDNMPALLARANALQKLRRFEESLACYRQHGERSGYPPYLLINIGALYRAMGELDKARAIYRRGLSLQPANAGALYNYSNLLKEMGRLPEAIRTLRRAIALEPENPQFHWNLSLALLMDGRIAEGFAEYEWRWRYDGFPSRRRDFPVPMWDGQPFAGKTLLIHTEQGMGDVFQFLRFLPRIKALGGRVVLESHEPLIPLLSGRPDIDDIIPRFAPPPPIDLHLPLLSAPLVLGARTLDDVAAEVPYLHLPPGAGFPMPEADPRAFKVGIVWGGNPNFAGDRARSSRLEHFLRLLAIDGVQVFSLQKGPREEDLAGAPPALVRLSDRIGDFRDTAAAMRQLDLVISTCTSTAHLAGALGRPLWVLVHHAPDWRWMVGREDSPWYPTARVFRQQRAGDWDGLLERVADALRHEVESRRAAGREAR